MALQECDGILLPILGITASDVLYPDVSGNLSLTQATELFSKTSYCQPLLVVLEYCLAQSYKASGIWPSFVIGHSLGEYAAAIAAGIMSLKDGLKLVEEGTAGSLC